MLKEDDNDEDGWLVARWKKKKLKFIIKSFNSVLITVLFLSLFFSLVLFGHDKETHLMLLDVVVAVVKIIIF